MRATITLLALLLLSCADASARKREKARAAIPPTDADVAPRKVQLLRILQDDNGRWFVIQAGADGIANVYDGVPPFDKIK